MKTNKKLSTKISAYSLMSSAFVAAGVHQAEGQIVYIDPVDMPIEVNASFMSSTNLPNVSSFKLINIDVENTIDPINIFSDNQLSGLNSNSNVIQFGILAGGTRADQASSIAELDSFAASAAMNRISTPGFLSSLNDIPELFVDAPVLNMPPGSNARIGAGGKKNIAAGGGTYWSGGNFANNQGQLSEKTGYIGVTFMLNGESHNAWVQLSLELNTEIAGPNSANSYARLTIHDFAYNTVPGEVILVGQTEVLPVELTSFTSRQDNGQINLNWSTSSEINHDYFELEKSENGRDFETIHRIEGEENSTETKDYEFIDTEPFIGDNYYRLKQVDLDGSAMYSKMLHEKLLSDITYTISPNPFINNISIQFPNKEHNGLFISLINTEGKSVYNHFESNTSTRFFDINIEDLPNGVYFLQIIDNDKIIKEKLIKH